MPRVAASILVVSVVLVACSDDPTLLGGGGTSPTATATGTDAPGTPTSNPTANPTSTPTGTGTTPPAPPTPPGAEPSDAALNGIVAAHNAVRAGVQPAASPPLANMQWSDEDAAVAKAYAAKCVFAHNPQRGQRGENIYAAGGGGSTMKSPKAVVDSWASEAKNYTYATNQCSGVCGHYTQVVWRESVKVGCAAQRCTTNSPFGGGAWELWVCNYSPPGNFNGRKPY